MVNQKIQLIIVGIIFASAFVLFALFDLGTLFSFDLALDATHSGGQASQRGVDASTGHFRGKGFGKNGESVGSDDTGSDTIINDSNPDNVQIVDTRTNTVIVTNAGGEGGGAPASTVGLSGFQVISDEEAIIFPSIHTPAREQEVSASILIQWKGVNPLEVQQVVFSQEIRDFVSFRLPQDVFDTDRRMNSDGFWEGEFVYNVKLPHDFPRDQVVPVTILVDTGDFTQLLSTDIEFTEPQGIIKTFSLAEAIRSFLLLFRIGV